MTKNAYELIEKDLLVAHNQILSYVQSDRPNNSANQMSRELRFIRVNESIEHFLEKIEGFGPSLGDTYIAESDLYDAVTSEKKLFGRAMHTSNDDFNLKLIELGTRMKYFSEFVQKNKALNLDL